MAGPILGEKCLILLIKNEFGWSNTQRLSSWISSSNLALTEPHQPNWQLDDTHWSFSPFMFGNHRASAARVRSTHKAFIRRT